MPILKINSGGINDKGCYFEMEKEDVNIFLDFEIIFNGLNGKVKEEMVRRGGSNEHCDAISISQNMIKIYELSLDKDRPLDEYIKKYEYCMRFIDYFDREISKIVDKPNVELIMVVNPSIVEKVNKEIKKIKIAEHFSRPAFMRFGNITPIVKICKNENT